MLMPIKNLLARNANIIAIALTIFITIASLVSLRGFKTISINISNFDKIIHFTSYFLLTLSWFFATQHTIKKTSSKVILIGVLIAYGIIIEVIYKILNHSFSQG